MCPENVFKNIKQAHQNHNTSEPNSGNTSDGISSIQEFVSDLNKKEIENKKNNVNENFNFNNTNILNNAKEEEEISNLFSTTKTDIYNDKKNKINDQGKNTENDISSIVSIECYSSLQECENNKDLLNDYSNRENSFVIVNNNDKVMFAHKIVNYMVTNFDEMNKQKNNILNDSLIIPISNNNSNDKIINLDKNLNNNLTNFSQKINNIQEKKSESSKSSNDKKSSQIFSEIQDFDSSSASTLIESKSKNFLLENTNSNLYEKNKLSSCENIIELNEQKKINEVCN